MIKPALSHPEIVVTAVASRDPKRGQEYAIKYHIPIVYTSYQGIFFLNGVSYGCTAIIRWPYLTTLSRTHR